MDSAPSSPPLPAERRPIAARSRPVWIRLSEGLAGAGVSPNAVSIVGMGFGLAAGLVLAGTSAVESSWATRALWAAGAAMIALRLLCNMLDGMVAQAAARSTRLGALYNEVPDRVSDAAALIGLGFGAGSSPRLGLLAALMAVFVAYIRAAARVAGAPQDFRGPMAKQQRMVVVIVAAGVCAVAGRVPGVDILGGRWSVPEIALAVIIAGCAATAVRRLVRAAAILRAADAESRP